MADEKRGEGRGAESFETGRRVEVDARLGKLYEARNEATGTPALTLVPSGDVAWQPEGPCRMSLTYEPARESVTVDVEQAPALVRTSELTNLLVLMTAVFRRVEDDAGGEAHLASGPQRRPGSEVSTRHRRPLFWSGLTAVGAAVLTLGVALWFGSMQAKRPAKVDSSTEAEQPPLWPMAFIGRGALDLAAVAYPLPEKPVSQQAIAPCEAKNGEVEINKGCWVSLEKKPPCAPYHAEYQGKCYLPVRKPTPVPQSVTP